MDGGPPEGRGPEGKEPPRLPVGVGDVARFVKEEEAVVHRFEDEVQFLVFRAGLFDSARKAGRQAVQRGDEDVEFVAGVQEDAAREVAAHDVARGADDEHDGRDLPVAEPEREQGRGDEREEEGGGQHRHVVPHGGVDGRERRGGAHDADEAAVPLDGHGDIEHVFAERVAVARGAADLAAQGLLDFGPPAVTLHRLGVAVRVCEHHAFAVGDGDGQAGLGVAFVEVLREVRARAKALFLEAQSDDLRVHLELLPRVFERLAVEILHEEEAQEQQPEER